MTGKHGSLLEYIAVYKEYGGQPPIPDAAPEQRGDRYPARVWIPLALVGLALGLAVMSPLFGVVSSDPADWQLFAVVVGSISFGHVAMTTVLHPAADWIADVPRVGLYEDPSTEPRTDNRGEAA